MQLLCGDAQYLALLLGFMVEAVGNLIRYTGRVAEVYAADMIDLCFVTLFCL